MVETKKHLIFKEYQKVMVLNFPAQTSSNNSANLELFSEKGRISFQLSYSKLSKIVFNILKRYKGIEQQVMKFYEVEV